MGGFGSMAGMITSLKNNMRRKTPEHFVKDGKMHIGEPLEFVEVSEEKRKAILANILLQRKKDNRKNLLIWSLGIILFSGFIFLFFNLFSKSQNELILGKWEVVAIYDLHMEKSVNIKENKFFAKINKDYLSILDKNETFNGECYNWVVEQNQLILNASGKKYSERRFHLIRKLDDFYMVIEFNGDFRKRITFKRVK